MMKYKRCFLTIAAVFLLCSAAAGCAFRTVPAESASGSADPVQTPTPAPELPVFTVTYTLDGQEIGADVYIDLISDEVVSIFTKKKIKMRAGETDKAVSFKDPELFALIEKFVNESGYRGQIDIDIFEIGGQYYISEVNPRFGGGYPHAYEAGCDHMKLILNNLSGIVNKKNIGAYEEGIYMMKYNEVKIVKM